MDNPFAGLKQKPELETWDDASPEPGWKLSEEERRQKRDAIYAIYAPLVNEVLDLLIEAYRPGVWRKGDDCSHQYCCRVNWFAGPVEKRRAAYDDQHAIRRKIEVTLEQDSSCNPTGFKIIRHEKYGSVVRVGLSRAELIRGIQSLFA